MKRFNENLPFSFFLLSQCPKDTFSFLLRNNSCTLNLPELINLRIFQALKLRNALGLPAGNTDVFRMVNSEGDRYCLKHS